MTNKIKQYRYDYFLIWGHGLKYKYDILNIIRSYEKIDILKIYNYRAKNIKKLVKAIYSYDYAPFQHLKAKTKYLLTTPPEVMFIFLRNNNAREVYTGEGQFRHIECEYIKNIKEEIRNKFNERRNDRRTEDHVVHASDNESQTDYILKYLGFKDGIKMFNNINNSLLSVPYHIKCFNNFVLKYVSIDQVRCSILIGNKESYNKKLCKIEETPHFLFLKGIEKPYRDYLNKFYGYLLTDYYSIRNFKNMASNFSYLKKPYTNKYILVKEVNRNNYQVLDGVHRASIFKFEGCDKITIAVAK